ncbi:MAG: peptide deformylase [Acidobacteriota bacterium]
MLKFGRSLDGKLRPIIRMGHPVLRRVAEDVGRDRLGTRFLRDLGRDLVRTMFEDSGVGLAAPQVAVPLRAFAYYLPGDGDEHLVPARVVINPRLVFDGEPIELGWEGCLSIPGLRGLVPRYPRLRVEALDVDGATLEFEAEGFHARVIQHEYDHLDGVLFVDRMKDMSSLSYEEEWDKYGTNKDLPVEV